MRKNILALEEMALDTQTAPDVEIVEDDLPFVMEAGDAVEQQADDIGAAVETAEVLEQVQDHLAGAEEGAGVASMAAVSIAVEALMRCIGSQRKVMPAMESLKGDRVASTKLAMESIGATVKRIWDAIVAAIGRAVDFIVDFVQMLFTSSKGLRGRCEALLKQARSLGNSEPSAGKQLTSARLYAFLDSFAGFIAPEDFASSLEKHSSVMKGCYELVGKVGDKAVDKVSSLFDELKKNNYTYTFDQSGKKSKSRDETLNEIVADVFGSSTSHATRNAELVKKFGNKVAVSEYPTVFNNTSLVLVTPNNALADVDFMRLGAYVVENDKEHGSEPKVDPLTATQAVKALEAIKKNLGAFDTTTGHLKSLVDKLRTLKKEIVSKYSDFSALRDSQSLGMFFTVVSMVMNIVSRSSTSLQKLDLRVMKQSLDYVQGSLKLDQKWFDKTVNQQQLLLN